MSLKSIKNIYNVNDLKIDNKLNFDDWTILIPAAGKGSRLNFNLPKLLYPIGNKLIIDILIKKFKFGNFKYVFVLSNQGIKTVETKLKTFNNLKYKIVIQHKPKGMADALLCAKKVIKTKHTLVIWGDQVGIKSQTLIKCMELHSKLSSTVHLTLPSILIKDPYINIVRDSNGSIKYIQQKREGEIKTDFGETDCGVFLFKTKELFEKLLLEEKNILNYGAITNEFNLIPIIKNFDNNNGSLVTVRLNNQQEILGINNFDDVINYKNIVNGINKNKKIIFKLSIIIPAYNEEKLIGNVLSNVLAVDTEKLGFEKEIIVINDGSTDKTEEIIKRVKHINLINKSNGGKGSAVKLGIKKATGDFILIQDADMEYYPSDYIEMLKKIGNSMSTVVYGSRIKGAIKYYTCKKIFLGKHPKQSFGAYFANILISIFTFLLYGRYISDMLTAYKIYPAFFMKDLKIDTNGFETDHEISAKLIRNKFCIIEVPIKYNPRTKAEGKKISMLDGFIAIKTLFKYRFININ
jgi:dolichol-phosphate mannosyltransferase